MLSRLLTAFVCGLMCLGSAAAESPAEPVKVDTHIRTYEVSGLTAKELWDSIQRHGPLESGSRFAAYTTSHNQWRFQHTPSGSDCAITRASVHTQVHIQLPRWDPPLDADAELVRRWTEFSSALKKHEQGHEALARQSAHAIHAELMAIRTPACDDMDAATEAAVRHVNADFEERAHKYDRDTQHGRTQGAYWTW